MATWIGVFIKPEPKGEQQDLSSQLIPALSILKAAIATGVMVKLVCAPTDIGDAEDLQSWLATKGIPGVVATDKIDGNCIMIIGTEVFRIDQSHNWFCPPCKVELAARNLCHGITVKSSQDGGFLEFY
ncbi:MAG: hypothetical protein Q7W55_02365 [Pseudohongiella sp.]|nr:hypothetical protein [Pseudohongiella sp.]